MPPTLLTRHLPSQLIILHYEDPSGRRCAREGLRDPQPGSPPYLEELEKLLADSVLTVDPLSTKIMQSLNLILMSPDNGGLVKEAGVPISIPNPLDPRLLPLQDLPLSKQRIVYKESPPELY